MGGDRAFLLKQKRHPLMTANTERFVGAEHSNVDSNPHDLVNANRSVVQVPLPAFTEQETRQREGTNFPRAAGRYAVVGNHLRLPGEAWPPAHSHRLTLEVFI